MRLHIILGKSESELLFPWQQIAPIGSQWGKSCEHSSSSILIESSAFLPVERTAINDQMGSKSARSDQGLGS